MQYLNAERQKNELLHSLKNVMLDLVAIINDNPKTHPFNVFLDNLINKCANEYKDIYNNFYCYKYYDKEFSTFAFYDNDKKKLKISCYIDYLSTKNKFLDIKRLINKFWYVDYRISKFIIDNVDNIINSYNVCYVGNTTQFNVFEYICITLYNTSLLKK
jgi:hypothetical protein